MEKKINLEKIIKDELYNRHLFFNKINNVQIKNICLEFGKQLLELAAENAKIIEDPNSYCGKITETAPNNTKMYNLRVR